MKVLQISEDILPLGQFKARASEVIRRLRSEDRAVVITQNGRPAAVLVTPHQYDELCENHRLVQAVREGAADADAKRLIDDEALTSELDAEFGPLASE